MVPKTSPHWALPLLSFFTLYEVLPTFGHLWIAPFSLGSLARAILGSCRISEKKLIAGSAIVWQSTILKQYLWTQIEDISWCFEIILLSQGPLPFLPCVLIIEMSRMGSSFSNTVADSAYTEYCFSFTCVLVSPRDISTFLNHLMVLNI